MFNPTDLSHLKYHFYAIMGGLLFSMFSIIVEDIGITVSIIYLNISVFRQLWDSQRFILRVSLCVNTDIYMALVSMVCL